MSNSTVLERTLRETGAIDRRGALEIRKSRHQKARVFFQGGKIYGAEITGKVPPIKNRLRWSLEARVHSDDAETLRQEQDDLHILEELRARLLISDYQIKTIARENFLHTMQEILAWGDVSTKWRNGQGLDDNSPFIVPKIDPEGIFTLLRRAETEKQQFADWARVEVDDIPHVTIITELALPLGLTADTEEESIIMQSLGSRLSIQDLYVESGTMIHSILLKTIKNLHEEKVIRLFLDDYELPYTGISVDYQDLSAPMETSRSPLTDNEEVYLEEDPLVGDDHTYPLDDTGDNPGNADHYYDPVIDPYAVPKEPLLGYLPPSKAPEVDLAPDLEDEPGLVALDYEPVVEPVVDSPLEDNIVDFDSMVDQNEANLMYQDPQDLATASDQDYSALDDSFDSNIGVEDDNVIFPSLDAFSMGDVADNDDGGDAVEIEETLSENVTETLEYEQDDSEPSAFSDIIGAYETDNIEEVEESSGAFDDILSGLDLMSDDDNVDVLTDDVLTDDIIEVEFDSESESTNEPDDASLEVEALGVFGDEDNEFNSAPLEIEHPVEHADDLNSNAIMIDDSVDEQFGILEELDSTDVTPVDDTAGTLVAELEEFDIDFLPSDEEEPEVLSNEVLSNEVLSNEVLSNEVPEQEVAYANVLEDTLDTDETDEVIQEPVVETPRPRALVLEAIPISGIDPWRRPVVNSTDLNQGSTPASPEIEENASTGDDLSNEIADHERELDSLLVTALEGLQPKENTMEDNSMTDNQTDDDHVFQTLQAFASKAKESIKRDEDKIIQNEQVISDTTSEYHTQIEKLDEMETEFTALSAAAQSNKEVIERANAEQEMLRDRVAARRAQLSSFS